MSKTIAASVLALGVAFGAPAVAQHFRSDRSVMLHIVSPTGTATTLALDRGDLTLAVANDEVRLSVRGEARVIRQNPPDSDVEMTNPVLVFSRPFPGDQKAIFQLSADRVTKATPDGR